jgi:hypothetical protein
MSEPTSPITDPIERSMPPGDDDERHADADDAEERRPGDEVLQVVGADELRIRHRRRHKDDDEQTEDAEKLFHANRLRGSGAEGGGNWRGATLGMVRGIRLALGSPLTPALSPLRGEGAQVMRA